MVHALTVTDDSLAGGLTKRGVSRRSFLQFCAAVTAILALPESYAPRIARALEEKAKPVVVWLKFQDCTGNTESFLRAHNPGIGDILLDVLAVEYHDTIMAAAGTQASAALKSAIEPGGHIVVVEGSIPLGDDGVYCVIGGKSAIQVLEETTVGASMIITAGTCSTFGGLPAAAPNPTGAVSVADVVSGVPIVSLPGCPMNVDNMIGAIVHILTFGAPPAADRLGRPLFAYGERIHDHCERRAHFDAGQFAVEWGDEGHKKGWCLYKMGCKGPSTFHNCPSTRWNGGTNWPVGAGHGCVGCSEPGFWDTMTPIYNPLPAPPGFGVTTNLDSIGLGILGATAVGFGAHGVAKAVQRRRATPISIRSAEADGNEGTDQGSGQEADTDGDET
ncbi:MAG: hydrogenase small subunit [Acidimicrobiia bacterium]